MSSAAGALIATGAFVMVILVCLAWWRIPVVGSAIDFLAWRVFAQPVLANGYTTNGDVRISYTTYGNGPPLVLLHGGLSSSLDWLGEIPALAQRFRVVTIDLRGHGSSTLGTDDFSYRLLAGDALAVLDQLDIGRADIVGWSDGGNAGLLFALQHPDRIRRLIAISANFHPDGIRPEALTPIIAASQAAGSRFGRWLHRMQSPTPHHWPRLRTRVTAMWQSHPRLTPEDLTRVRAPTLIIVGSEDQIELPHATLMAEAIPLAELVVLPDIGHSVPRDAPKVLLEKIFQFLPESAA